MTWPMMKGDENVEKVRTLVRTDHPSFRHQNEVSTMLQERI